MHLKRRVRRFLLLAGITFLISGLASCSSCPGTPPSGPAEIPGPMVSGPPIVVSSENFEAVVRPTPFLIQNLESQSFTASDLVIESNTNLLGGP